MKTPEIRFKSFTENWDNDYIKNIGDISTGKSNTQDQDPEGKYPFFIRSEIPVKSNKYLYDEEAVITIGDGNIGKVFHYINGKFDLHQRCYKITNFKGIYGKYFYYYFSTKFYKRAMSMTAKATVDSVRLEMISDMNISFPDITEQKKIGYFFENIDNQITKNEEKLVKLKNLKQAFLQKMFPKQGKKIPEIRFKSFEGDWEENELNIYLSVSKEKNINDDYGRKDVLSVSGDFGVVNQIEFQGRSFAGKSVSNYGIARKGYVIYTKSPLKVNPYGIIKSNKGKTGIVSVLYAIYIPKENCNPDFVQIYFEQNERLNNYLRPLISKGAKNTINISDDDALKGLVKFPSKEEQDKIVNFFEKLDNQISSYSEKIEKLKNIKQSLLEKMFI